MFGWWKGREAPRVSIVICSIDSRKFERITSNYTKLFANLAIEVIGIHDAKSLAEAYNRALGQVRGEFVIFSHDDIRILSPDFADRLIRHFERFDMFGVAGTRKLVGGAWFLAGHPFDYQLVTSPHDAGNQLIVVGRGVGDLVIDKIQALDGLFMAARSRVAKELLFDADTFDNFHLYDLDFSYRAFLRGYKLGVCRDIFIVHDSHGNFDDTWRSYRSSFEKKFRDNLPLGHRAIPSPLKNVSFDSIIVDDPVKLAELCRPETMRQFIPQSAESFSNTAPTKISAKSGSLERDVVVILAGRGANDAVSGLMEDYGNVLRDSGLSIIHVTFDKTELDYAVKLMSERKVLFAMTWLGLGQDLAAKTAGSPERSENLFELFQVPLVKIQGDLPAYYIDLHRNTPKNSVNLYQADEFLAFRKKWLPEANTLAAQLPPMPMLPVERTSIDIKARREGTIYFVKNGNSPEALERKWETLLPLRAARTVKAMARELRTNHLKTRRLLIGDFVASFLESEGIASPIPASFVWFFSAQLDDYLRRLKSTMIAEAVLDLPVVVQGDHWDHIDFTNRRARHVPGKSVNDSQGIVLSQLGVIDMAANVDSWPHDRVQRAAGAYSLVLTDRHDWLTKGFPPEFTELSFEFDPDSIASRIADVLDHRDRYVELAIEFGEQFRERFPRPAFADRVATLVDYVTTIWQEPKPVLQEFFVWSRWR